MRQTVEEWEVLIAVAVWLVQQEAQLVRVSLPRGQPTHKTEQRIRLKEALKKAGYDAPLQEVSSGPDIVARLGDIEWKIECKGAGTGQPSTYKNNFDRGLASAVSYYTKDDGSLRICLAIPFAERFLHEVVRGRVPGALMRRLNLRVLIVNVETGDVVEIDSESEALG